MDFEKFKQKLKLWRTNAIAFVEEVIGATPTWQQKQLLRAVSEGKRKGIAVRSGHGTGKSSSLSWIVLWFLLTRPSAKVVCTAPSKRQLYDILWAEISKWIKKARLRALLEELLDVQSELIKVGGRKDWFARAVAVNVQATAEEQAETLAGYHAEHLLCIVDEASGVPDPVFRPIDGYMTQEDNFVILAGNPTRAEGYFHSLFDQPDQEVWTLLHWNSEESPLVSKDWIEMMKRRYGEDSNTYRIRVLGEFPITKEEALLPFEWIRRQTYTELPDFARQLPAVWGLDVARLGFDETALCSRKGAFVEWCKTRNGLDSVQVVDWVLEEYSKASPKPSAIIVDVSGSGTVADFLRESLGTLVIDFNFGWKAFDSERFVLIKDELFWKLREVFEMQSIFIPASHEKLVRQLASLKFKLDQKGRIRMESKKEIKKRGLPSPDCADALVMTFYLDEPVRLYQELYESSWARRPAPSWRVV